MVSPKGGSEFTLYINIFPATNNKLYTYFSIGLYTTVPTTIRYTWYFQPFVIIVKDLSQPDPDSY